VEAGGFKHDAVCCVVSELGFLKRFDKSRRKDPKWGVTNGASRMESYGRDRTGGFEWLEENECYVLKMR
jgi:hypothetical protein